MKDCQEHVSTHEDNRFSVDLSAAMSDEYGDEESRTSMFRGVLQRHGVELKTDTVVESAYETDTDGHISVEGHPLALSKGENEWINIYADPALQSFMYYIEALKFGSFTDFPARLPCLIIYYVGERIHD